MKILKTLSTLAILVVFAISGFTQNNEPVYTNDISDWEVYKELNGVVISSKIVEYHDEVNDQHKELWLLKFTNTTDSEMQLTAKKDYYYEIGCENCDSDSPEYLLEITLAESEVVTGDPITQSYNELIIHKRFLKYPIPGFVKFELSNLEIKPI